MLARRKSGIEPEWCLPATMPREIVVWRFGRSCLRAWHQGSTPLGHREYVEAQLQRTADDQQLLDRIPLVRDLQSAWLLLLFCASTRANCFLRVVHPSASESFARHHDSSIWQCFSSLLGQLPHHPTWEVGGLPLCMGVWVSKVLCAPPTRAHWASWADCFASDQRTPRWCCSCHGRCSP